MCGICGFIGNNLERETGMAMVMTMHHRGPDYQDVKIYKDCNCALGHARLSIIDLSASANQPMEYGQYSIVFNGEIYNFKEIRKELEQLGHQFVLDSDTEVILHAFAQWGNDCVGKFVGMFAFALLDRKHNKLILFRDRAGIKPLYYFHQSGTFMFASELKAFYPHPDFRKELNKEAVGLYFKYGYVPAPYAIFKDAFKLLPGHCLEYDISSESIKIEKYWDVLEFYRSPLLDISYEEAKGELERLLKSSFDYRMVSDVPVGVFLSGGYDSALLTTLLQKDRTEKIKTFTIGFEVEGWNEAPAAAELARMLGTDHTEMMCTEEDCKRIVPELPFYYDEPFSDNSAVPTILVSRLARKQVTVALSADGGDETFAGYNRYAGLANVMKFIRATKNIKGSWVSDGVGLFSRMAPKYSFYREKGEYLSRMLNVHSEYRTALAAEGGAFSTLSKDVYTDIVKMMYPEESFLLNESDYHDPISVAMAMDYVNYMPNDILVKVDRATMSTSLEGREPLLDHRIIEFASRLPIEFKYKDSNKKRIYKDILYKYVPREMMERPKTGFMMPVEGWLRKELRYLLEENLNESMNPDLFNVKEILKIKNLFYQDKLKHENKVIWRILAFQLWYNYNLMS